MSRTTDVPLTAAQIRAAVAALDSYLLAGTADECETIFGSPQATGAAARASDALKLAGNRLGAFGRRARRS
jgi:hypothetical protein